MEKKKLTLLGIWNILPVGTWTWSNDIMVEQLKRLTGEELGIFFYLKGDLDYECFTEGSTEMFRKALEVLTPAEQVEYVERITKDYYKLAEPLQVALDEADKLKLAQLSNAELAASIMDLAQMWSRVTGQIWYAVLLDIWYPGTADRVNLKQIIAPARDHCGHLHERSDKVEHKLYVEAAKRLRFSERQIYSMIQPEIAAALNGSPVSKKKLQSREELWIQSNVEGRTRIYEGEEAVKLAAQYDVPKIGPRTGTLKGTPASKGKVQGIAHVILLDREFPEFKDGEILVSLQTMVHYLPIMKKSIAILTEFGGLTSHAAIVSRELGKPCVVGISGLISSIKTGDKIEVDATRGIIRKLS